jgi:hypothetical protein
LVEVGLEYGDNDGDGKMDETLIEVSVFKLLILVVPYLSSYSSVGGGDVPRRYHGSNVFDEYKIFGNMNPVILLTFFMFSVGQLIYLLHLVIGFINLTG